MFLYKYRQRSIIDVYNKKCKKPLQRPEKHIVYKHTNIVTGKCYVGQTCKSIEERWNGHVYDSKKDKPNLKFHRAIKKYGEDVWTHEILEELDTELFCNASEIYWIDFYRSADKHYGYNLTHGGEGGRPNAETREKISKSNKIAQNRPEVKQRKSELHKGKSKIGSKHKLPMSEEHKLKLSVSHKGKKRSEESKRKNSEANKGEKNPNFGKKQSPETISKRVEKNRGKKRSEESRRHMSKSKKGYKNPMFGKKMTPETIAKREVTRRHNKEIKELGQILLSFYEPGTLWNN